MAEGSMAVPESYAWDAPIGA